MITSIFPPSDAVREFVALGLNVIVVGDRKTPPTWECAGAQFISIEQQRSLPYRLMTQLPFDHYARKLVGYLEACRSGAEAIVDSDDDNVPRSEWAIPPFDATYDSSPPNRGFVNVYRSFTDEFIWPRGFPLEHVLDPDASLVTSELTPKFVRVGVWQGLADGDPDVDAIYRLTRGGQCVFTQRPPLVLGRGTISPFNSQNTIFRRELFPLLFLPATVRFRFTDILRGLVAQPIMWNAGYSLGVFAPNVVQRRNQHDLLDDFGSELDCYTLPARIIEIVSGSIGSSADVADNLRAAYRALAREQIVRAAELDLVEAWLTDLEHVCQSPAER